MSAALALAGMLVLAQVETSTVVFTPQVGRLYRDRALRYRGERDKALDRAAALEEDLDAALARVSRLEQAQLAAPTSCPECGPQPWGGWPWVTLIAGTAIGAFAAAVIIEGPPR